MEVELLQDTFGEGLVVPPGTAIQGQLLWSAESRDYILGSCLEPLNRVEIVPRTQRNVFVVQWLFLLLLNLVILTSEESSAFSLG